jgi:hypothetical protein
LKEDSILDAINKSSMFNLIDVTAGDKVDFWILTKEPFDQSRFSRKIADEFMGLKIQISSPEDTILAKLRWARLSGGSEKQFNDALRVYEVQYEKLNLAYLKRWVKELDVAAQWECLLGEAETI